MRTVQLAPVRRQKLHRARGPRKRTATATIADIDALGDAVNNAEDIEVTEVATSDYCNNAQEQAQAVADKDALYDVRTTQRSGGSQCPG